MIFISQNNSQIADINVGAQAFVKMHSLDQTVNKYGRCLVNWCNSNNLSILNERTRGGYAGKIYLMDQVLLIMQLLAVTS